ncbi:Hypothetical predicted protein [Octopus vulgaris]|uniref:Transmembrane protein n=1 Tax=Octopus vulgaris TaxID=6645 RepID=A0AA36FGQ5_OCTVU|nr:Hypothetical predicted protein [Octopus vulgaris]
MQLPQSVVHTSYRTAFRVSYNSSFETIHNWPTFSFLGEPYAHDPQQFSVQYLHVFYCLSIKFHGILANTPLIAVVVFLTVAAVVMVIVSAVPDNDAVAFADVI